jgi:hypothetical protein
LRQVRSEVAYCPDELNPHLPVNKQLLVESCIATTRNFPNCILFKQLNTKHLSKAAPN